MTNTVLLLSASGVFTKIWTLLLTLLFFGFIIALHEFGHFITAKLFGMKVNEFSIGMGPAFYKFRKKETQYSLRALPIGGYVALEGEDEDSEDPRAFGNQKAWKRFIVIAAGATLNVILGFILMIAMLANQGETTTRVISDASESLIEAENGVHIGDEILSVDGIRIISARDLYYCLFRSEDDKFDITLKRDGQKLELHDVPIIYDAEQGVCSMIAGSQKVNVLNVIPGALRETRSASKMILLTLVDMFRGKFGLKDLSGPVGTIDIIADTAGDAVASADYSGVLFLLAFVTINIGIVNLLPLPALDGGRLFFILIELVIRKPVPKKFEGIVHTAGIILLLLLMAVITFHDIYNIATR